ncbi:hypothetical protein N8987_06615 [Crocinitomix sp.]|nr:hypothetical protein [Crocinitomix sp.]
MTKNLRIVIYSAISILAFTAFFYFYPAAIFEAEITDVGGVYQHDIPLSGFVNHASMPAEMMIQKIVSVSPTWKGGLLLLIILIGIPIMIGFRIEIANTPKKKNDE